MWGYFKKQTQTDCYADKEVQREITTFHERFQDQIASLFHHLTNVCRMVSAPHSFEEEIVNLSTDCLMDSMNGFAQNCYELHKNRDTDGLDLAKQKVEQEWNALSDNFKNEKTAQYRNFFDAALTQNRLIQISTERQESDHEMQSKREALKNSDNLSNGFTFLITNMIKSEDKTAACGNHKLNDELQRKQQQKLKQFRAKHKPNGRKYKDYVVPNTASYYFTKSGQNAAFLDLEDQKDEVGDILMNGTSSNTDKQNKKCHRENAVIVLSPKQALNNIAHPMPCIILSKPSKKQQKYNIRLANPYGSEHWIHPKQFDIKSVSNSNEKKYVQEIEVEYMRKYKIHHLGYSAVDSVCCDEDEQAYHNSYRLWIKQLSVGCKVDAFDGKKWFIATVIELNKKRREVKVHFDGFKKIYDEWVDVFDKNKIAPECTHTAPDIN